MIIEIVLAKRKSNKNSEKIVWNISKIFSSQLIFASKFPKTLISQ